MKHRTIPILAILAVVLASVWFIMPAPEQADAQGVNSFYREAVLDDARTVTVDVAATGTQSTGTSLWIPMTLEPGTYVLICFFPDISDGMPHAFHGMYNVVEVSE